MLPKEYGTSPSYFGTEEWRYFYSAAWQLLEERVDEDADSTFEIDQLAQQFWGLRYIDDAVARRVTSDWEEGWDRSYYHITNVQFSTENLISHLCELVERIRYDAYGRARHIWRGDLDQDGTFWFIDRNIGLDHIAGSAIGDNGTWPSENYNVLMDFDFSGTIEQDEYDAIQNDPDEAALAAGRMSDSDFASGPWNPIGYDGYVYDDGADMSCVRFRWYEAKLGRWMSRDSVGFVDGSNLFEFVQSTPTDGLDPLGRWKVERHANFRWALATTEFGDTFAGLAPKAGLTASEFKKWAEPFFPLLADADIYLTTGNTKSFGELLAGDSLCPEQQFSIPNTVLAFLYGGNNGIDNVLLQVAFNRDNHIKQLKALGIHVVDISRSDSDAFLSSIRANSNSKLLLGLYLDVHHKQNHDNRTGTFWGRGIGRKDRMSWDRVGDHLSYRIGFGYFAACDTLGCADLDRIKSANPLYWFTFKGSFWPRFDDPIKDGWPFWMRDPDGYLDNWGIPR